jgi:hypothetical protein
VRWDQGRAEIDAMIAGGELQRVPPSREHADQLVAQALKDLGSAELLCESNPKRAYESIYDAARMALTAVRVFLIKCRRSRSFVAYLFFVLEAHHGDSRVRSTVWLRCIRRSACHA